MQSYFHRFKKNLGQKETQEDLQSSLMPKAGATQNSDQVA